MINCLGLKGLTRQYAKHIIYVYFNSFRKTVNSHNMGTAKHIAHFIFMLHSVMKKTLMNRPIKMLVLSKLFNTIK